MPRQLIKYTDNSYKVTILRIYLTLTKLPDKIYLETTDPHSTYNPVERRVELTTMLRVIRGSAQETRRRLQGLRQKKTRGYLSVSEPQFDLETITKPGIKSIGLGQIVKVNDDDSKQKRCSYGVTAPL